MRNDCETILQNVTSNKVAGFYNIGKTIGKGHFAVVKEARHVFTQEKVAIKIIDKTKLDKVSRDQLLSEVMCMKLVQHPNIVRLYEVMDTVNKLYLVLELGDGGDLYDYLLTNGSNGLPEEEAKRYFRQILRALAYCHKLHVVHRDIKPENVVFFKQSEIVKLTDFGFSNKFTPGETLNTSCGSLAYSAPEILLGDSYDAPKVDIWSLGVILFMLVIGSLPFNETNDSETIANIMDCKYTVPSRVSESCRKLIGKMLKRDAQQRASLDNIINDEWLRFNSNLLEFEIENYTFPLISREHLTLEEHIEILTKMSDGNLSSVEETQMILDSEGYNHISATYFLLAERKLKRKFLDKYIQLKSRQKNEISSVKEESNQKSNQNNSVGKQLSMESSRRISMILEGEETEENEELEAMASLATVRRELESFVIGNNESDKLMMPGTAAPNPSRCVSRISSVFDLHSASSDGYDSDTGLISNKSRRKLVQKFYRSFSSFSGQILPTVNQLPNDLIEENYPEQSSFEFEDQKKLDVKKLSLSLKSKKRSQSATEISNQYHDTSVDIHRTDLSNNLHIFSSAINTNNSRRMHNSNKYAAVQHVVMNDRRLTQVIFDTGSNSTSANCSSPDISDVEIDPKSKIRYQKNNIKKMDSRTSEGCDYHDICEPINEEDEINRSYNLSSTNFDRTSHYCFRSRSFDGRFTNLIQVDPTSEKPTIFLKSDNISWHSNSISRRFADSNFSLSSFASKLDQQNMMKLIRGTFELQIRNIQENSELRKSLKRNSVPTSSMPLIVISNSSKQSPRSVKVKRKFKKSNPKFKIPFLSKHNHKESTNVDESRVNFSKSCHILPLEQPAKQPDSHHQNHSSVNTNINSQIKCLKQDYQKEKNHLISLKRDHLVCCTLS